MLGGMETKIKGNISEIEDSIAEINHNKTKKDKDLKRLSISKL